MTVLVHFSWHKTHPFNKPSFILGICSWVISNICLFTVLVFLLWEEFNFVYIGSSLPIFSIILLNSLFWLHFLWFIFYLVLVFPSLFILFVPPVWSYMCDGFVFSSTCFLNFDTSCFITSYFLPPSLSSGISVCFVP